MLRGQLSSAQQLALLSGHDDLAGALEGAFFVQVTLEARRFVSSISLTSSKEQLLNSAYANSVSSAKGSAWEFGESISTLLCYVNHRD